MKNVASLISLLVAAAALLVTANGALATIYEYVDGSGNVVMTNNKASIPPKFRATMKVIKEETERKAPKAQVPQTDPPEVAVPSAESSAATPAATPAAVPEGRFAQMCADHPWLRPLAYFAGCFAALMVVIKVASLLPSPQMAKAIYLLYFLGVGVFIYKLYVDQMVENVAEVKRRTVKIVEKANQRPDPTRDILKEIPEPDNGEKKPN